MIAFDENTRVKIPATVQFMRLGYNYQSLKDIDIHSDTRIALNRFKPAIERINGRTFSDEEILSIASEIHATIKNNDMGQAFYKWLVDPHDKVKLIDFENIKNNDFAVVNELFFGPEEKGSFRPDITILINGIPLAFLEVKKPNNDGGIQAEFNRMLDKRLDVPEFKKYFNMLQIVSFSNNMEYEDDDSASPEDIKAGSFYTTPNGRNTSFSFFRDEQPKKSGFLEIKDDIIEDVLRDNHYSSDVLNTPEFQTNLDINTPCNRFVSSLFDPDRIMYFIQYGMMYVAGKIPQKHIMRYPQYFASKAIVRRLEHGGKSGIIFHTQGSGKTGLSAFSVRILRDYYAVKKITARFYYVVDRLDLLTQVSKAMKARGLNVINVTNKDAFQKELDRPLPQSLDMSADAEITVVNIHKFDDKLPTSRNDYNAKIQRIFFVDEAHRSYSITGEFFKNLMLVDADAVYIAMTGTPLLSKKERSNLKFGDYIHKYFYDKSIADGYTLRIKKESINTTARAEIKKNLGLEASRAEKSVVLESENYINALCKFIEQDFTYFRLTNSDNTIGGMIVCSSNTQAKKIKEWFKNHSDLQVGIVITDESIPTEANKNTQLSFQNDFTPDMVVVHQMLTTGYDVDRLKKMYLLRNAREHTLLQTISRVNRPYKSPTGKVYHYGYIVDFVDIEEEYDRTIEMYLKEIEEDFGDDGEGNYSLSGLIIGPEDINKKYIKYKKELDGIIDTTNVEKFTQHLVYLNKDALLTIRRLLNGIKQCYTEFCLSRSEEYISQIDIKHINKLLKEVQHRIDFINLRSKPTDLLSIVSNKEVVEIIYEFFKVKISILDLGKMAEVFQKFVDSESFHTMQDTIGKIQDEVKKNKNHNQIKMIQLDELLKKLFEQLDIVDLNDLGSINEELAHILNELRKVNEENEKLAARYDGNYAFVKTYTDMIEMHPEHSAEDIASVLDIVYGAVKDIKDSNILIIQGRDNFAASIKKLTTAKLLKSGLYKKLRLKDWYTALLNDTYSNMKLF